jgi:transcriptional regulator with AAA-type ATPase domain
MEPRSQFLAAHRARFVVDVEKRVPFPLFWHIFDNIVGESMPIARLRAAVWQSIFTHDMRRYRRSLYNRISDVTTLITDPSGTGKELVARAIGLSQYIAFDAQRQCFSGDMTNMFLTLNLSALSPTLIESELFGHRKGAFTGAVADRAGWLEISPRNGTVFLDEIGELDAAIQVKLLRVVQSRVFQRLGETDERPFHGKIIAATNRDLAAEIRAGRFREDFCNAFRAENGFDCCINQPGRVTVRLLNMNAEENWFFDNFCNSRHPLGRRDDNTRPNSM